MMIFRETDDSALRNSWTDNSDMREGFSTPARIPYMDDCQLYLRRKAVKEYRKYRYLHDLVLSGLNEIIVELSFTSGINPSNDMRSSASNLEMNNNNTNATSLLQKIVGLYERVRLFDKDFDSLNSTEKSCESDYSLDGSPYRQNWTSNAKTKHHSSSRLSFKTPATKFSADFCSVNKVQGQQYSTPMNVEKVQSLMSPAIVNRISRISGDSTQNFLMLSLSESKRGGNVASSSSQQGRKRLKVSMKRLIGEMCYRIDRYACILSEFHIGKLVNRIKKTKQQQSMSER